MCVRCNYCGQQAEFVNGKHLYPNCRPAWSKEFWLCRPCDARVGCHRGTRNPLGSLANAELRALRKEAHKYFDTVWKGGKLTRGQAYKGLARLMGMTPEEAHIGKFSRQQCLQVIRAYGPVEK